MKILSALISVYMLLLFIRILLTWFQGPYLGKPIHYLVAVTEPYLAWFRRLEFLRTPRIDFSPIAALLVLVIIQNIIATIARLGTITLGIILGLIISALWSAVSFLIVLFIILTIIRLLGLIFRLGEQSPFWQTLDLIIQPVVYRVSNLLSGNRTVTYQTGLAVTGGSLIVVSIVLRIVVNMFIQVLMALPF